jgi:N-ethylmaleimide reductase
MSTTASPLFTPVVVAGHTLAHRVVMAPMTRARSTQPGDVPNAINARYFAPFLTARGMACPDILPTILAATEFLQARGIGYLHLVEADWDDAPQFTEEFRQAIRARFKRPIIVAGNYDKARADWVLSSGYADLVAFGRPFVANPDFPRRLANDLPLAGFDDSTLFGGDERGYIDYPASPEAAASGKVSEALNLS